MPEGWDASLNYDDDWDQIEDEDLLIDTTIEFWEIIVWQVSFGHIPDGYPFTPEGSAALIKGEY